MYLALVCGDDESRQKGTRDVDYLRSRSGMGEPERDPKYLQVM